MKKLTIPGGVTRRFLLSYLMILLIPLVAFSVSYNKAMGTIEKNSAAYHLSMLDQARNALETQVVETQRLAMHIARDQIINDYLYSLELGTFSAFRVWEVQNRLVSYLATNQYASQIYICAQKDHTIISSSYYHKDSINSKSMSINGSDNLILSPLFQYSLGSLERVTLSDNKINEKTMMFIRSFPDGAVNSSYGNICIVYDENKLKKLLSFSNSWINGFNLILNQENQIIASEGNNPGRIGDVLMSFEEDAGSVDIKLDNEAMTVTYMKSPAYGWTYLSVYPKRQVFADTIKTRNILLFSMLAACVISFFAAALFAMKNAKPIRKVMTSLVNSLPGSIKASTTNEYSIIQSAVEQLVAENRDLAVHSDDQRQLVKEAFFRILMSSRFIDSQLVEQMSQELGVDIKRCAFIGVQFAFEHNGDSSAFYQRNVLTDEICRQFSEKFGNERCAFFSRGDSHLVLLCFMADQRLGIYAQIGDLTQRLEETFAGKEADVDGSMHLLLGISNVYTDLHDICKCSEEAQFSLEYSKLFEFGRPVFYDTISTAVTHYKFTLNDHQRLLNILKSGNTDDARKIFRDLRQNMIIDNKINALNGEQMFYAIKGVLLEGMDFIEDDGLKEKILLQQFSEASFMEVFHSLEEDYIAVTKEIGLKKENKWSMLIDEVLEFLKREYADSGISITSVASGFNISEAYLSRLFREKVQRTFAAWLEDFRLEKAKKLLTDGHSTMVDIAEKTGYNSVESFRRAFKRAVGVAPSEYKASCQKNSP